MIARNKKTKEHIRIVNLLKYTNENVDYISLESMPYYENNVLKIKCSVYQVNSNKDEYENKDLTFISNDNGLNWNLENN